MSEGDDDIVGYGRPPRATRFAKGKSGNPDGRPKGARNKPNGSRINEIILQEALQTHEKDGQIYTTVQAIMRSVIHEAGKGDFRSKRLALSLMQEAERSENEMKRGTFQTALAYKEDCEARILHAKNEGLPRPKFPIDPDDIHLDPVAGTVNVSTLTDEENAAIIGLHNYRWHWVDDVAEAANDLVKVLPASMKHAGDDLLSSIQMLKAVERLLGGPFELLGDGSIDGLDFEVLKKMGKKKA